MEHLRMNRARGTLLRLSAASQWGQAGGSKIGKNVICYMEMSSEDSRSSYANSGEFTPRGRRRRSEYA